MIRDEFKNVEKEVLNKKANAKMQQMGERAYYAKKLSFYSDIVKPVNISSIFCTICFMIMAGLYILTAVLEKKVSTPMIIITSICGLLVLWTLVWFIILRPLVRRKAEYYKSELTRLNREYVMRHK